MRRDRTDNRKRPVGNQLAAFSYLCAFAAALVAARLAVVAGIIELPEIARPEAALGPPAGYVELALPKEAVHKGELILVNGLTPYHFPEQAQLVNVSQGRNASYAVKDAEQMLAPETLGAFNRMMEDFARATGASGVDVISGYRTYGFQEKLLAKYTREMGEGEAAMWAERPGGSEHHTGLALDLGLLCADGRPAEYTGEGAYAWINENCRDYGFIVRYASDKVGLTGIYYEPWHFRYVGAPHAGLMAGRGLCLEEYTEFLKGYPFGGRHLLTEGYEVYYVPADGPMTKVPVPADRPYTVSGNNVDGFVVTAGPAGRGEIAKTV